MASSSSSHNYEVFLSFRGVDTRRNFTDHLYHALDRVSVRTFRDNEELKQGQEIGPELLQAIKESKISIPIFSKNYASSKWCLKEIAKIMDCWETDHQVVLPIFYKVEPSDVRNQSGSFAQAFLEHEKTQSKETLDEWRKALSKAGSLSGWDSEDPKNSYEAEMIDSIVGKALSVLNKNTLEVAEHPIGMDARVEEVLRLIDVKSRDVQFVGIHGIGGIGKTTIAKAVFNRISRHFQVNCFLPDVRERASHFNGLVNLQNDLTSDVRKGNDKCIKTVAEGIILIKERFCSKKVLIILDDVDEDEQLNKLAGRQNWFGPGSTIIITTRDKHILNVNLVDESKIYMPNELDVNQSLQLFSNHAFGRDQPLEDFKELSKKILVIIGGLPLALKVLGSFLRDKRRPTEWESTLEKLKKIPDAKVQGSLQISYDGLIDEDKEIFLDIACFFIGMDEEIVIHILEDHFPEARIKVLVLKSLVRIDHNKKLGMHDLIRDMGREIVRKKSPDNLEMRCRLWSHEEAFNVLKKCKGKQNVKGLALNFGSKAKDGSLKVEAFKEMSGLRLLQIDHAYLEGDFDHFPGELKWLSWKGLPMECIPTISHLEKLSVLDLSGGMITDDWSGWQHIQLIKTLKVLDLRDCFNLTRTPNFSHLPSLKRLILDGCEGLVVFHESIGQLKNLDFLSLKGCVNLVELPDSICKLSSVKRLILLRCSKLERLPKALDSMISLTELDIGYTHIGELPDAIGSLDKLEKLCLVGCSNLVKQPCSMENLRLLHHFEMCETGIVELPEDFGRLSSLKSLDLGHTNLCRLPVNFSCLSRLQELYISWCGLVELPEDFGRLSSLKLLDLGHTNLCRLPVSFSSLSCLQELYLSWCGLVELPEDFGRLSSLKLLDLELTNLCSLPVSFSCLSCLQELYLGSCGLVELPVDFWRLSSLKILDLNFNKLRSLPASFSCLSELQTLKLVGCDKLQSIPELPSSLVKIAAHDCSSLERLPELSNLKFLQELNLSSCEQLSEIQGISGLPLLQTLDLRRCTKLQSLPELPSSLVTLDIKHCISMEILPNPSNLKNLEYMCLSRLLEIQGMKGLVLLQKLHLVECEELQSLPELPLGNLRELLIMKCRNLSEIQGFSCLPRLQKLSLKGCKKLQSLPPLPSSLIRLEAHRCISLETLPDMSNLKILEALDLWHCNNLAEIRGLEGLESLIELNLHRCNTYINNFLKIVAQEILPRGSYGYEWRLEKEYLIPDDDNINGMVFFLVFKLPTGSSYDSDRYDNSYGPDSSDDIDSSDDVPIKIQAGITRNDGKRISCGIHIIVKRWKKPFDVHQLYSCYFPSLTWFGIPLHKGDILRLETEPPKPTLGSDYLYVRMPEFVVADEAVEDDQQLKEGVKHLMTSILKGEPRKYGCVYSPYRMPSVSGKKRMLKYLSNFI